MPHVCSSIPAQLGDIDHSDCRGVSLKFYLINRSINMAQVHFPARFLSVKPQLCAGFQWLHLTPLQACLGKEPGLHRSKSCTVSDQKCSWIYKSNAFKYPHLQDCSWKNEMKGFKNKKMQLTAVISPFFIYSTPVPLGSQGRRLFLWKSHDPQLKSRDEVSQVSAFHLFLHLPHERE